MSESLNMFVSSFLNGRISVEAFVESYAELWKIERDLGVFEKDSKPLSEFLSTVFCIADLFNPSEDRLSYEIEGTLLTEKIAIERKKLGLN